MEWWVWITQWFLFCFTYSRLYQIYHKNHETLTAIPPIHVYIHRVNNRAVYKIKDGYKLELPASETMKLFCSTKKLVDRTKKRIKGTKSRSSWSSFSPM